MEFTPDTFQLNDYLSYASAMGLTGNPGVVAWLNFREDIALETEFVDGQIGDGFLWAIGDGNGAQYGSMKSWNNPGPEHRMTSSTMAGNCPYVDSSDETWGYYRHTWVASGTVADATVYRNGAALSLSGAGCTSGGTSPTLADNRTVWGSSSRSDFWFGIPGYSSTLILMAAPDTDDDTDFEAAFGDWN